MKQPDEGNLFTDLMELGPAPTMARELVVIIISVAMVAVIFTVFGPTVPMVVAAGVIAVFLGVRFVIGLRHWRTRS
ncbi:hypothetical protein ABLG96_13320 [Nakamurella sp. A5-74]|uniref:DUF3040 domain-containing protein n=1 Tax=Nakamurella sp. A5-74 TaxID=3158264 RepID=A0AAU8DJG4_9ACTN